MTPETIINNEQVLKIGTLEGISSRDTRTPLSSRATCPKRPRQRHEMMSPIS